MKRDDAIKVSPFGLAFLDIGNNEYMVLTRLGPIKVGQQVLACGMTHRQAMSESWIPLRTSNSFYGKVYNWLLSQSLTLPDKQEGSDCGEHQSDRGLQGYHPGRSRQRRVG